MDWKFLFFASDGRISRQQFWIGALILIGAGVVLGWIPIIGWLASLVALYCWVCLYSKRLHDFGKSGWLVAIPVGLMAACAILGIATMGGLAASGAFNTDYMHPGAMMGMGLTGGLLALAVLVSLGFLLWVGLTPSQPGANQYGEPATTDPIPEIKADAPQG